MGEEIRDHVELGVYLYPKGQEPKYRDASDVVQFVRAPEVHRYRAEFDHHDRVSRPAAAARLENFQPHMHLRGKAMAMEAILPDGTTQMFSYVNNFNFNWMTNYIYADDSAPVLPKGTIHPHHGVVRQYDGESE